MSTKTVVGAPLRGFKSILEGKYFAWILLLPSLTLVVAFIFYPVYRGVYLSFTRTVLLEGPGSTFIGLENNDAIKSLFCVGVLKGIYTID